MAVEDVVTGPDQLAPPSVEYRTEYPVTAAPVATDALQLSATAASPADAVRLVAALGTAGGGGAGAGGVDVVMVELAQW
jgi:hypothetical protein